MKTTETKWGHPIFYFLIPVIVFLAARAFLDIVDCISNQDKRWLDYFSVILSFIPIGCCIYVMRKTGLRWEISEENGLIELKQNGVEVYRGSWDDLRVVDYDFGMIRLENTQGGKFTFPAFGKIKKLIMPPSP